MYLATLFQRSIGDQGCSLEKIRLDPVSLKWTIADSNPLNTVDPDFQVRMRLEIQSQQWAVPWVHAVSDEREPLYIAVAKQITHPECQAARTVSSKKNFIQHRKLLRECDWDAAVGRLQVDQMKTFKPRERQPGDYIKAIVVLQLKRYQVREMARQQAYSRNRYP